MVDEQMCESTHVVPTAEGDQTVRCELPTDHLAADPAELVRRGGAGGMTVPAPSHFGRFRTWPVTWTS